MTHPYPLCFFPAFSLAGTKYVHVCFPDFFPDRCICEEEEEEEEEEGNTISDKLKSLHNGAYVDTIEVTVQSSDTNDPEEVIFCMARRELYESVAASGEAYFPHIF